MCGRRGGGAQSHAPYLPLHRNKPSISPAIGPEGTVGTGETADSLENRKIFLKKFATFREKSQEKLTSFFRKILLF